ncbi:hypothetical protein B0J14DRAFT_676660 [Halenospora varia]|nr:hypothetical protein B0J14DRAFT_676660 [Halenospora varia]
MTHVPLSVEDGVILGRQFLCWDTEYNHPIHQNNRVLNPHTGIGEDAQGRDRAPGPPAVDFFVHNIRLDPRILSPFRGFRAVYPGIVDDVVAGIGKHLADGEYELMSINTTRYSVVLILMSRREAEDLQLLFRALKDSIARRTIERSKKVAEEHDIPRSPSRSTEA